ncbi:MAG: hypothetical protein IKA87_00295 [Lentisphaeria bacterium]|nr:hypothetical protein [Lentisphaeria bacterium]
MKKIFLLFVPALLLLAGCHTPPESLPPITLRPDSRLQIVLPEKNEKALTASALLLQRKLAEYPGIKTVIAAERNIKRSGYRSLFIGPAEALAAVGVNWAEAPEKAYGVIISCGGDIFISGFNGKEKRIENSGTGDAVKKFIAKYLTPPEPPVSPPNGEVVPFVCKFPMIPENLVFYVTPEPVKKAPTAPRPPEQTKLTKWKK